MNNIEEIDPAIGDSPDEPINVLVVDDDRHLRDVVEQSLVRLGFNVMTACEGSEGLQVLLSNRFDVVVSDLMMEPMDGITFLTEALRIWPWMGVVVFSGYIKDDIRKQATDIGVRAILEKPISFDQLVRNVTEEAKLMRKRVATQNGVSLNRVLYQLSMLRDNTRTAIEATSINQALVNLSRDLGVALPSIATAIMSRPNRNVAPVLAASLRRTTSPALFPRLEATFRERFATLAGDTLPETLNWEIAGKEPDPEAEDLTGDPLSFPIISGGKITGLLVFVPPADYHCSESDISFLYHAANHLTTILIAFYRIRELAVRDELTSLYNRHHLQSELPSVWEMAKRYGLNPALMILDVDHFKLINDNYGHSAGDETLRTLGKIARQACRGSDLIARYGGDEIMVVLPDADPGSIGKLAERMQSNIREHLFSPDTHAFHCTVSIGAASCRRQDGHMSSVEELLAHADEALYTAKRNGRNRAIVWTNPDEAQGKDKDEQADVPVRPNIPSVLVIDDDPSVLKIVKILLEVESISVKTFESPDEALETFQANPPAFDAALVDLNLGATNGLEVIRRMSELNPFLVSIIITGDATLDNAISSLRHGAYDFIQKPIQRNQLKATLNRALEYHHLRLENQEYQQNLEAMVKRKSIELTGALKRTRDAFDFTLRAMTAMLDAREHTTGAHSVRVQEITVMVAKTFDFNEKELDGIRQGALLHDIGKIAVPDHILLKPGPLTDEEWLVMRSHVNIGYDLIKSSPDLKAAADIMLSHHEHFDGSGYPNGLRGEEIPVGARIFSVVDAYDAMRSTRPYRIGMPKEEALAEIQRFRGSQFDPQVVDRFFEMIDAVEQAGNWKDEEKTLSTNSSRLDQ